MVHIPISHIIIHIIHTTHLLCFRFSWYAGSLSERLVALGCDRHCDGHCCRTTQLSMINIACVQITFSILIRHNNCKQPESVLVGVVGGVKTSIKVLLATQS